MDRNLKTLFLAVLTGILLVSCDQISKMQIPETVSVKTSAEYSVPLGTISKNLSDYFSASTLNDTLESTLGSDSGVSVYDYNPGETAATQEYLINYPITSYDLDFGSEFSDIASTSGFSEDVSQTLSISAISQDISQSISLSSSEIESAVGAPSISESINLVEPGDAAGTISISSVPEIDVSISDVDSVTYSSGSLDLTLTSSDTTAGFYKSITASLYDADDTSTVITSGTGESTAAAGSDTVSISLPLSGKTLPQNMILKFSGSVSGGTLGNTPEYNIDAAFNNANIASASGVSTTISDLAVSQTISFSNDLLQSAVIDTGSLIIKAAVPDGWSGVTCTFTDPLTLSGGLSPTNDFESAADSSELFDEELDLKGSKLSSADIVLEGTAALTLDNATVTFTDGAAVISITGSCSVSKLQTVTINASDFSLTSSISKKLENMEDTVIEIDGVSIPVTGTFTNGLPDDNDITLNLTSSYFTMSGETHILTAGTTTTTSDTASRTKIVPADDTITLTPEITLPGYNSTDDTATFSNIEMGTDYTVSASFSLGDISWDSVIVDIASVKDLLSTSKTIDMGMDFSSIFSALPSGIDISDIQLSDLPLYLYVIAPSAISSKFTDSTLSLSAAYTDSSETDQTSTFINSGTSFNFVTSDVDLENTDDTYTGDIGEDTSSYSAVVKSSDSTDGLVDLFNNQASDISLTYAISLSTSDSTITLYQTDLSSASTVTVKAIIELPLNLIIANDINMDIGSLAGLDSSSDIFERTEATNTSDIEKYLSAIDKFEVDCNLDNQLLTYTDDDKTISLVFDPNIDDLSAKTISSSGESVISFTSDEILDILTEYPFSPSMTMTIPAGTVTIPRDASISTGMVIDITTDGTVNLFGGEAN